MKKNKRIRKLEARVTELESQLAASSSWWVSPYNTITGTTVTTTKNCPPLTISAPYSSISGYSLKCTDGLEHTYPEPWLATVPPACLKCGTYSPYNAIPAIYSLTSESA